MNDTPLEAPGEHYQVTESPHHSAYAHVSEAQKRESSLKIRTFCV